MIEEQDAGPLAKVPALKQGMVDRLLKYIMEPYKIQDLDGNRATDIGDNLQNMSIENLDCDLFQLLISVGWLEWNIELVLTVKGPNNSFVQPIPVQRSNEMRQYLATL